MNLTTEAKVAKPIIGVDLAKNCFQLVRTDENYRSQQRERLSRTKFARLMSNQPPSLVLMEACGSAHFGARELTAMGHEVRLLPAQHVRAYVRRNKTDAADAAALIEASRCADIKPVAIKTVEHQVLQQLHRLRSQWQDGRTARINGLRGMLRECGIDIPVGALRGLAAMREALQIGDNGLPDALRPYVEQVLGEIADLQQKIQGVNRSLEERAREDRVVRRIQQAPGVGLIISTGMRAAVPDIHRFPSGRHFSSWLGITTREHSSGERRRLGRISKQGDVYLRTQLVHGARSLLRAARIADKKGQELDRLRRWAVETERRVGHNKAAVAVANKLARIIWAIWKHERDFNGNWSTSLTAKAAA